MDNRERDSSAGSSSRDDRKRNTQRHVTSQRTVMHSIWRTLTFAQVLRSLSIRTSLPRGAVVRPSQNVRSPPPNANIITYATNGPPRLHRGGAFRRPNSATGSYSGSSSSGVGGSGSGNSADSKQLAPRPASAMSKLSVPNSAIVTGSGRKRCCLSLSGSNLSNKGSNKRRRSLGSGEVYGNRAEGTRQKVTESGGKRKKQTVTGNPIPVAASITESASQQSLRDAAESALRRTDTYRHLVDINLHRWIVWLVNRCYLLPHIYVPSLEHFTFGSIHDISYRLQQVEDASIGAGKFSQFKELNL